MLPAPLPDDAAALADLGVALARQGDPAGALAHLERAVRLRPDFAPARHNFGVALAQSGRRDAVEIGVHRCIGAARSPAARSPTAARRGRAR